MWQMILSMSEGNPRRRGQRGTSEDHGLLSRDISVAEVAAMAMKAFPGTPAPRGEEAEHITGAPSSDCTGTRCLSSTLTLLTVTFGDCLIRAHYKHQVTFARS